VTAKEAAATAAVAAVVAAVVVVIGVEIVAAFVKKAVLDERTSGYPL
jgi:hypothetical protein